MYIVFCYLLLSCLIAKCHQLTEKEIKFASLNGLLAAFGDFNSDKLTDVFVIAENGKSFQILRQYERGMNPVLRVVPEWFCRAKSNEIIVGLIPSDFSGDAILDVVVITKTSLKDNQSFLRLLRGSINSSIQCDALKGEYFATVKSQPLVLDLNGDMISDLLAENPSGAYKVWMGSTSGQFKEVSFPLNGKGELIPTQRHPNSNAFVDLNGDLVADIFINGEQKMQYWFAGEDGYLSPSVPDIPYPKKYSKFGSSAFFDINGDAIIDHVIPSCHTTCSILVLKNFSQPEWEVLLEKVEINGIPYTFSEVNANIGKLPAAIRIGDINGDGFPDLITLMQSASSNTPSAVLLLNVKSNSNSFGRSFSPILYANQSLTSEPKVIAFFDLYEDGRLDVMYSGLTVVNSTKDVTKKELQVNVVLNEELHEANFLKVLVTSGLCLDNSCYEENFFQKGYRVPYGTNKAGPTVCYEMADANGNKMKSCAGQLPQSANFALQLPYCLFGLGPDANYIDHVHIAFPTGNTSHIYSRDEMFIVPDSQIVVIPHPVDKPAEWIIQLFLTPSDIIYKTLYTFLGICGGLIAIIIILHHRERLKDLAEQEQYRLTWPDRRR